MLSGIIQLFIKIKQTAVMKINFRIGECRLSFMRIVPFESRNNVSIDFTEAQPISASYAKKISFFIFQIEYLFYCKVSKFC